MSNHRLAYVIYTQTAIKDTHLRKDKHYLQISTKCVRLTTTFSLWALTVAPNHWFVLNSIGSLVPLTLIFLLSDKKKKKKIVDSLF